MNTATFTVEKEYKCDVLVCGGGMSGFAAAVSAARSGAEVILIESGGYLGGTATKGLVGPFMTCYDAKGENPVITGLFTELVERMVNEGGAISYKDCPGSDSYAGYRLTGHIGITPISAESLKRVTEAMCLESQVKLLYHTILIGCETDGRKITKVYAADSNRIISIEANMFIDTTGTAALAAKAGAETVRGNENGMVQTASLFFNISGVDKEALDKHMAENTEMRARFYMDEIEEARKEGRFPCGTNKLRIYERPDGSWVVNMAQVDEQLNELDNEAITSAEISQRKQIVEIFNFLKNTIPALKNIKLLDSASDLGIRESRRVVGHTVLSVDDMMSARRFDDRVVVCASSVDIHHKEGVAYSAHASENYYIPLSAMISKSLDNLLTAGKTLSADSYVLAAVRVMPPCVAMGEAVGITAAMASRENIPAIEVSYKAVQEALIERGAFLD